MIIDFDDITTYPDDILKFATKNDFDSFNKVDFDIDFPYELDRTLNEYKFIVYHCTRTMDINNFKTYGILIPNSEKLKKILYDDTDGCNIDDIGSLSLGRGLDIQFVFSYDEICNDKQYMNFFNHIGGEIIEFTNTYDEERLKKGSCYIIKFLINGFEIEARRWLIQKMIRKVKYNIPVNYSGSITRSVIPRDIIEYIPADKVYQKLKEMI